MEPALPPPLLGRASPAEHALTTRASCASGDRTRCLADLLLAYRCQHGLSMRQAGALVEVSRSAWRGWEAGVVPSPASLVRVAALLNLTHTQVRQLSGRDRVRRPGSLGDTGTTGLAAARVARGLSATALAGRLHVSLSCLSRWESGERVPDRHARAALAQALGLTSQQLHALLHGRTAARDSVAVPGLRACRRAAGISQRALAAHLGVDPSSVRRWERTGQAPARHIVALEHLLGPSMRVTPSTGAGPQASTPIGALTALRRRRGLPVVVVAARLGTSPAAVWAWERGERHPDWHTARRLARVLNARTKDVFHALSLQPPTLLDRSHWTREEIPAALRELRRWNGLTQAGLAAHLGVGTGTIAAWEKGDFRPGKRSADALRALPVPLVLTQ